MDLSFLISVITKNSENNGFQEKKRKDGQEYIAENNFS